MGRLVEGVNPNRTVDTVHRLEDNINKKKVSYATSETFLVEMFDELCTAHLSKYNAIAQVEKDVLPWIFIHQHDDDRPPEENEEREYGKVYRTGQENEQLRRICFKILDYHEDDLYKILRKGLKPGTNLKKEFCWDKKLGPIGEVRCNNPEAGYPKEGKHEEWKRILKMTQEGKRQKRKKLEKAKRERLQRKEDKRRERINEAKQKKKWLEKQKKKKKKKEKKERKSVHMEL